MKEKEKLLQEVTLLKMNELKPNYSELSRIHECDRRTIKKYFNGYTEKSKHRNKKSKLDIYEDEINKKADISLYQPFTFASNSTFTFTFTFTLILTSPNPKSPYYKSYH